MRNGPMWEVLPAVLLWQQSKPLSPGEVARCDDLEVAAVQGGDLVQVESLGKRYHAGIDGLEPQR